MLRPLVALALLATLGEVCALPGPQPAHAVGLEDGETRRRWVLELFAKRPWEPLRKYAGDAGVASGCLQLASDLAGIAASLELGRLSHPLGVSAERADPWLVHIAREVRRLNGPIEGAPGPCRHAGGPSTSNAAARLGQLMLRNRPPSGWSPALRVAARAMVADTHWAPAKEHLSNLSLGVPLMNLLVGEALCDADLWARGVEVFNTMFRGVLERGGFEMNAIHYSHHHFDVLFATQDLADPVMREQGRLLLEYELLTAAHLYLPGAGLLPPYSRAREGALRIAEHRARSLGPIAVYLSRDPEVDLRDFDRAHGGLLGPALTDYVMPEIIRAIFLERGAYRWGARQWRNASPARSPHLVYPGLGWSGRGATFPREARVLAGAKAGVGLSHGAPAPEIDPISSGVHVRCPRCEGGWIALFQGQRLTRDDVDATGSPVLQRTPKGSRDAHDEGGDFAGQLFGDTLLRLWSPAPKRSRPFTEVFLPDWGHPEIGGQRGGWPTPGGWYVGELSGVRVGFRPLGTLGSDAPDGPNAGDENGTPDSPCGAPRDLDFSPRRGSRTLAKLYRVLCLVGASGGITVLESGDGRDLAEFAADLDARHVTFLALGPGGHPVAEVETVDDTGRRCRIRLAYRPGKDPLERRWIDCTFPLGGFGAYNAVEVSDPPERGGLDFGLMHSPWVRWTDAPEGVLRVSRAGFPDHVQHWNAAWIAPDEPRPQVCGKASP